METDTLYTDHDFQQKYQVEINFLVYFGIITVIPWEYKTNCPFIKKAVNLKPKTSKYIYHNTYASKINQLFN